MSGDTLPRARWVRCPACGKQARYAADNPARPFCSARCRSADLGAWASESYRVAAPTPPEGADDTPAPDAAH
ncbi:MAG TPA: DNA gyrase inhibitor YacG [Rubrivivax sp.]|nr:DNA gyrase inhibitor YacG [Rubrivivax sp.]